MFLNDCFIRITFDIDPDEKGIKTRLIVHKADGGQFDIDPDEKGIKTR